MSRDQRLRLAWLGFHPDRARGLRREWGGAGAVLEAIGRGEVAVSEGIRSRLDAGANEIEDCLGEAGARAVFAGDPEFGDSLSGLPDAPDVLFVRGVLPAGPGVAVVGSRASTAYGRRLARAYGRTVGTCGWAVVSGLARGVDGEAHRGCLDAAGAGVAVLGSGIDVVYPAEHGPLAAALVASGGALVSEYPPGTPPEGWRFPPRNRVISGLAAVVVVVEAAVDGGALITAARALDQGRSVCAVPGDVDRPTSRGCNLLIRDGAHPVHDPADLIETLQLLMGPPPQRPPSDADDGEELTPLIGPAGASLESLAERSGMPVRLVVAQVSRLEAAGQVKNAGGWVTLV